MLWRFITDSLSVDVIRMLIWNADVHILLSSGLVSSFSTLLNKIIEMHHEFESISIFICRKAIAVFPLKTLYERVHINNRNAIEILSAILIHSFDNIQKKYI